MSRFNILDGEPGRSFDVVAEAEFANKLSAIDTAAVFQIVGEALAHPKVKKLFVGLQTVEINSSMTSVSIRFRYVIWSAQEPSEELKAIPEAEREYIGMRRVDFVYYVLARIDQKYQLLDSPSFPSFRLLIDLPEWLVRDHLTD